MFVMIPEYYNKFKCIASKCSDNCCIGWEIDIDSKTYEKYKNVTGSLAMSLKNNIVLSEDGSYSFKLTENERCPFLDENNLCKLIIEKGEDFLCDICKEHPRFHNCFGDKRETGIGIGCIAAAEIILSQKNKVKYITPYTLSLRIFITGKLSSSGHEGTYTTLSGAGVFSSRAFKSSLQSVPSTTLPYFAKDLSFIDLITNPIFHSSVKLLIR